MFKFLKQLFCEHKWIIGRPASIDAARKLRWANMHNRVCSKCDKDEPWADKADDEYSRLSAIKQRLSAYKDPVEMIDKVEEQLDGEQ